MGNLGGELHFYSFPMLGELFWLGWHSSMDWEWFFCQSMVTAIEPFGIQAIKRCHWMQFFSRILAIFVFKSPFSTRKKLWPTWWPMWGPTRVQSGSQKVVVTFQPLRLGPRKQNKMESPRNSTQVRHPAMGQIPTPSQLLAHWTEPHCQSGTIPLQTRGGKPNIFLVVGNEKKWSPPPRIVIKFYMRLTPCGPV